MNKKIIVAIDVSNLNKAINLVKKLKGIFSFADYLIKLDVELMSKAKVNKTSITENLISRYNL